MKAWKMVFPEQCFPTPVFRIYSVLMLAITSRQVYTDKENRYRGARRSGLRGSDQLRPLDLMRIMPPEEVVL